MVSSEDLAAWEAAEDAWENAEQESVDLVRIRGFALAMAMKARASLAAIVRAEEGLERARRVLEVEHRHATWTCELAERMARFAERARVGDVEVETRRAAADALQELIG